MKGQGRAGSGASRPANTEPRQKGRWSGTHVGKQVPSRTRRQPERGTGCGPGRRGPAEGKTPGPTCDGAPGGTGAQGASRAGRRRRYAAEGGSPSSPLTGSGSHRPPSGPARSWASGARPPWRRAPCGHWAAPLPAPAAASAARATPPLHAGSCSSRGADARPHSLLGNEVLGRVVFCTGAVIFAHAPSSPR